MKHTPGPWTVNMPHIKPKNALGYLATLSNYDRQTQCADARLIAAAPDLLDTVRFIAKQVHQAYHETDFETCPKNTCSAARQVISQAENGK